MNDVRRLLAIKANIETAMQRDLAPHIRVFAQQQLDEVCESIKEAREDLSKLFEPQEIDLLKQRVAELEALNAEMLVELEAQRKECKWMPENPDCSDANCGNQDSCSLLRAIQKAKELTGDKR